MNFNCWRLKDKIQPFPSPLIEIWFITQCKLPLLFFFLRKMSPVTWSSLITVMVKPPQRLQHSVFLKGATVSNIITMCVWCNTSTWENSIKTKLNYQNLKKGDSWELKNTHHQVLRNEDSRLPFAFTFLFPQRQSGSDGYRGKHQREKTFLTVTAISALVISIRLSNRIPWDEGISVKTYDGASTISHHTSSTHTTDFYAFLWVNHLQGPSPLHVFKC